ncbi:MAG: mechanosensitive ion channel family protein [Pseudomonadota bacterium]
MPELTELTNFQPSQAQIAEWWALAIQGALAVIAAVAIYIIGSAIAAWAARNAERATRKGTRGDEALSKFVNSMVRWLGFAIIVIAILNLFGIEATSLVAVLGAATLAVGLALQGTMSNFASGVMLLLFRPFKIGDYVEVAGQNGTVTQIDLFQSELTTVDNVQVIVPNNECWSTVIINYSANDRRRLDMTIGVGYDADLERAIQTIRNIIAAQPNAHSEPAPFVKVTNLGDSAVDITLRVWTQTTDYWDLKFEITRQIKEKLDAAGVSIPYPHM